MTFCFFVIHSSFIDYLCVHIVKIEINANRLIEWCFEIYIKVD